MLNHENVERLRVAIIETPDSAFDYRYYRHAECGCVMPIAERVSGLPNNAVEQFTRLTRPECSFLIGGAVHGFGGKTYDEMSASEATGANGKREALRRLSVILQRRFGSWRVPGQRGSAGA